MASWSAFCSVTPLHKVNGQGLEGPDSAARDTSLPHRAGSSSSSNATPPPDLSRLSKGATSAPRFRDKDVEEEKARREKRLKHPWRCCEGRGSRVSHNTECAPYAALLPAKAADVTGERGGPGGSATAHLSKQNIVNGFRSPRRVVAFPEEVLKDTLNVTLLPPRSYSKGQPPPAPAVPRPIEAGA
ncbi:hypothetical protein AAFF_G00087830 [Aldrovandia affinis]|uniref:Uncharacterized protein n=1 Tax=Aldrovandia affinis TaxID=143900 RepID=A0AAD7RWN9_9TELE|nr:hypothetical protein AAFF_G00087830 [Aldrovandia affinis]